MSLVSTVRKLSISKVTPELGHSVRTRTVHWGMQAAELLQRIKISSWQEKPCQSDLRRQKQEKVWRQ